VGDSFRAPFTQLSQLVRAFLATFFIAGCRKARYLSFVLESEISPAAEDPVADSGITDSRKSKPDV